MKVASRVAWNAIVAWTSSIIGAGVAFVIVPFLMKKLGVEGYGVVELISTIIVFTVLTDLGIRGAMGRHLVEQIELKDPRRINELMTTSLLIYLAIGALVATAFWIAAEPLVRLFRVSPKQYDQAVFLVRYFVPISTILSFVSPTYAAVIEAYHRFDVVDIIHIGEVFFRAAAIVLLIGLRDGGIYEWAVAMLASKVLAMAALRIAAHRLCPTLAVEPKYLTWATLTELFSLGSLVFIYQTVLKLTAQTDPFVLSSFIGPSAVARYKPPLLVVMSAQPITAALSRQLRPLATIYFVQGRHDLVQELVVRGTRLGFLLSLPFSVVFLCFAFPLIGLWLGPKLGGDYGATAWVLILWCVADIASNATGAQWHVMLAINRIRFLVLVQSIGTIINLIASVLMVGWLKWTGHDASTCIIAIVVPTVIVNWVQRTIITLHVAAVMEIGVWRYCRDGFLRPTIVALVLTAVALTSAALIEPSTWPNLILCIAITSTAWLPLCWWIGFDRTDQDRFLRLFNRTLGQLGLRPLEPAVDEPVSKDPLLSSQTAPLD